MKYTAITYDDRRLVFEEDHLKAVEAAMASKSPIRLQGETVAGGDIRRIVKGEQTGEYGPHLTQDARDIFQLAAGSPKSFWKEIFFLNGKRELEGKPWLYPAVIDWAKSNTSFTEPKTLVEFIEAEWETAKPYNKQSPKKRDPERERLTREFYATEVGQEYLRKVRAMERR